MSEKQPNISPEIKGASLDLDHQSRENLKRLSKEAEAAGAEAPDIEELTENAEEHAISGKEVTVGEREGSSNITAGDAARIKSRRLYPDS